MKRSTVQFINQMELWRAAAVKVVEKMSRRVQEYGGRVVVHYMEPPFESGGMQYTHVHATVTPGNGYGTWRSTYKLAVSQIADEFERMSAPAWTGPPKKPACSACGSATCQQTCEQYLNKYGTKPITTPSLSRGFRGLEMD